MVCPCRGCPGPLGPGLSAGGVRGDRVAGAVVVVYLFRPLSFPPVSPFPFPGALTGGGKRKSRGECPGVVVLAAVVCFFGGCVRPPLAGWFFVRVRARARARVRPGKGPRKPGSLSATICPSFSFSWFWRKIALNAFFCPWEPCWLVFRGIFRPAILLAAWGRCKGFRRVFFRSAGLPKIPGMVCPPCGRICPDGISRARVMR